MEKRCIFHIPNYLNPDRPSASQIRPEKMKKAFQELGYTVDVVQGYGKERKKQIKMIRQNIKNGINYAFLYSESSTMPTLLTEKHHIPVYPFLDFGFFKYVKKNGIPIGLFYRDIYWKFPEYRKKVKGIKYKSAVFMYRYDLKKYRELLDRFYMPTKKMYRYLSREIPGRLTDSLPSGCEYNKEPCGEIPKENKPLTLLYVGGLGGQYQIHKVLEAVSEIPEIELILCCRQDDWEQEKVHYEKYVRRNIRVCHEKGEGLEVLYKKADIGLLYFDFDRYMEIAMPYKVFEYLGHGIPLIASDQLAAGDFVKENNIGWTLRYDTVLLSKLLRNLLKDQNMVSAKKGQCRILAEKNTWMERAKKVEQDLCRIDEKDWIVKEK